MPKDTPRYVADEQIRNACQLTWPQIRRHVPTAGTFHEGHLNTETFTGPNRVPAPW